MKCLMTTDSVGGVWPYTLELCRALAGQDCEVVLASLGGRLAPQARAAAAQLANVELHESEYRLEWMEDPWRDVQRSVQWLDFLAYSRGADVLHLNCYGPAAHVYDVPVVLVAHSCVHSWHRAARGVEPGPELHRYRQRVLAGLRHADSIIAPTAAFLAHFAQCYSEFDFRGRSRVIYNGVDPRAWPAARPPDSTFVLAVSRVWDEGKNLSRLAEAAPDLPCPVLIAGEGQLRDPPANLKLLGLRPRESLGAYYRQACVYAHPAHYEPFGLSVLEAAFSGCPLMLADIPSLRELWDGAAFFADPTDTAAWRDGLRDLVGNPARRAELGWAARQRAEHYSAAHMAAAYADHYRRMLAMSEDAVA